MASASQSLHSSASSPFDATLPQTSEHATSQNHTRTPEEASLDRSRKWIMYMAIFASLVASGWYMHKGVAASLNYHEVDQELSQWESAMAVVTGRNITYPGISSVGPFLPFFTDNPYYCAILSYDTVQGTDATGVSKTNCGEYAEEVVIGEQMEILYNPQDTEEVLEKEIVDGSFDAMIGAVSLVYAFAVGFLCCAILLFVKRDTPIGLERHAHQRQRRVVRPGPLQYDEGDVELAPEERLRRKQERKEEVLKHFHFETVASGENGEVSLVCKSTTSEEDSSQTTEPSTSTETTLPPPQEKQNAECCICMEKYLEGDQICTPTTNRCSHIFHKSCVLEWLQQHDHCPLCRVNLVHDGSNSPT